MAKGEVGNRIRIPKKALFPLGMRKYLKSELETMFILLVNYLPRPIGAPTVFQISLPLDFLVIPKI
jgi:hypothetical protein